MAVRVVEVGEPDFGGGAVMGMSVVGLGCLGLGSLLLIYMSIPTFGMNMALMVYFSLGN